MINNLAYTMYPKYILLPYSIHCIVPNLPSNYEVYTYCIVSYRNQVSLSNMLHMTLHNTQQKVLAANIQVETIQKD